MAAPIVWSFRLCRSANLAMNIKATSRATALCNAHFQNHCILYQRACILERFLQKRVQEYRAMSVISFSTNCKNFKCVTKLLRSDQQLFNQGRYASACLYSSEEGNKQRSKSQVVSELVSCFVGKILLACQGQMNLGYYALKDDLP